MRRFALSLAACAMFISMIACEALGGQAKPSAEEQASTEAAETAAAASPTSAPTETFEPSSTPTELPPTPTPIPPTKTPIPSPTPGPLLDDFSSRRDFWTGCDYCTWRDGILQMGPFPSTSVYYEPHFVFCEACGTPTFFRMAIDITYLEGPSERGFGLLVRLSEDHLLTLEINPFQGLLFWDLDLNTGEWDLLTDKWTGAIVPGKATNRLEVEVAPTDEGTCDIYLRVNGKTPAILYNRPVESGMVGITLYGHGTAITLDNFEFEELEP